MKWSAGLILVFIGLCYAEINIQNIPNLPPIEDIAAVKEKCDKKGGAGTYDKLKNSGTEVRTCLEGILDIDTIKAEVQESKKTGSMDEVFGKYCNKRPQMKTCLQKGIDAMSLCLEDSEKQALNITLNILKELAEFICFRDGDRIAMFVAEGGVECIKEHIEGVKNCVNATLKIDPAKLVSLSPNSIPNLSIDKKKCDDLLRVQNCVVEELEKCKDSTPANIVDALFRFIKKSACADKKQRRSLSKRQIHNSIAENQEHFRNMMVENVKLYCEKYGEGDAYKNLQESLSKSRICTGNPLNLFGPQYDAKISSCYNDSIKEIRNCLPVDLKYFPQFVVDILFSVTEYLKTNAENFKLTSTNMVFQQCFISLKQESAKKALTECTNNVQPERISQETFFKDEICRRLNNLATCASEVMKITCIPDIKLDKFRDGLTQAFTKPCRH